MVDLRQSDLYAHYQELRDWEVSEVFDKKGKAVQVFIKHMPVVKVSVLKCQRFERVPDWSLFKKFKKKNRVVYTVLEPLGGSRENYQREGYKVNKNSYLPTQTVVISLNKERDCLWNDLSKDARKTINDSRVEIRKLDGKAERNDFWKKWNSESKIITPSWKSFQDLIESFDKNMWLMGAFLDKEMVAGTIVLIAERRAYYYYAWTSLRGREAGGQYKLVWESILRLKKEDVEFFDLEGVEDERWPRKSWRGFSRFKSKFGGEKVSFLGSFSKWF